MLIPLSLSFAFAVVGDFSTDQSLYHKDDTLNISGNVSYDPDIPFVTIQIFTPEKLNFADFNTVLVNSDGSFSDSFHVGGPTWTTDGFYTIKVTYAGNLEKFIEYKKLTSASSEPSPQTEPPSSSEPSPQTEPPSSSEPSPQTEPPSSSLTTIKLQIPTFPSLDTSPQRYIERYNNEPNYKSWFDSQFPSTSIDDVVGYSLTHIDKFPSYDKSPNYYIERYNNEPNYKSWFDSQFPHSSIYNVLGYDPPESIPDWIINTAHWRFLDLISEDEFENSLKFFTKE